MNVLSTRSTALTSILGACLLLALTVGQPAAQTNLALNKAATASSFSRDETGPGFAVDGIDFSGDRTWFTATRWASAHKAGDGDSAWFMVDLEGVHSVNKVVIKWEYAFGRSYDILVSTDGTSWTTAKHIEWSTCYQNGNGGIDYIHFDPVDTRYVKFRGATRGTPYGYSFWELEVYADAAVPAELPDFTYPGPTAPFTIDGGSNPCEVINVGPVMYAPWMFHNNPNLVTGVDGWCTMSYPGGSDVQWTFDWKMANMSTQPVNNMAGIMYGNRVVGGAPFAEKAILPLPVTSDIHTTWKCTYSGGATGSYTVAYDMWTSSRADTCEPLDEVMIFLHTTGRFVKNGDRGGYAGSPWATPTIAGTKWAVFGDPDDMTKSFEPLDGEPVYDFSGNLKDFFGFLKDNGRLNGSYLHWLWAGTETGGRNAYDLAEGTLTTTEWTISSPDAPTAAPERTEPHAGVQTHRTQTAAQLLTTLRGLKAATTRQRSASTVYSLKGERVESVTNGTARLSGAVRVVN